MTPPQGLTSNSNFAASQFPRGVTCLAFPRGNFNAVIDPNNRMCWQRPSYDQIQCPLHPNGGWLTTPTDTINQKFLSLSDAENAICSNLHCMGAIIETQDGCWNDRSSSSTTVRLGFWFQAEVPWLSLLATQTLVGEKAQKEHLVKISANISKLNISPPKRSLWSSPIALKSPNRERRAVRVWYLIAEILLLAVEIAEIWGWNGWNGWNPCKNRFHAWQVVNRAAVGNCALPDAQPKKHGVSQQTIRTSISSHELFFILRQEIYLRMNGGNCKVDSGLEALCLWSKDAINSEIAAREAALRQAEEASLLAMRKAKCEEAGREPWTEYSSYCMLLLGLSEW